MVKDFSAFPDRKVEPKRVANERREEPRKVNPRAAFRRAVFELLQRGAALSAPEIFKSSRVFGTLHETYQAMQWLVDHGKATPVGKGKIISLESFVRCGGCLEVSQAGL